MSHETINYKGFEIKVIQDDDAQSPDDWGNDDAFVVYDHRRFFVERKGFNPDEIFEALQQQKKIFDGYWFFPLYAYIHSGVALSLGRDSYPFTCNWDTSFKGFVLVKKEKGTWKRDKARTRAESIISGWNEYLSGNVWGFNIEDKDGENIDSCFGFYGDYDQPGGMIEECKSIIDSHIIRKRKSHYQQVKTWIKNRVPLLKREALQKELAC